MMRKVFFIISLATIALCKSPEEGKLVQGDMELTPYQMEAFLEQKSKQNGFASIKYNLWKNLFGKTMEIRYYVDPQIAGAKWFIESAIRDYHTYTCLRFKEYSSRPYLRSHIFFTTGTGCSSPVGKALFGNSIRLAQACWHKGTIMHEIGHSIGLFHEQSRPDRDNYVNIMWDNIARGSQGQFYKMRFLTNSHGTIYDYDSMMHYGSDYFSKNGQYTIRTKDPRNQHRIGNRNGFSSTDIVQINRMYCN